MFKIKVIHIKFKTIFFLIALVLALIIGLLSYKALGVMADSGNQAAIENSAPIDLPILMYHSILKDPSRAGKYVLSPQQFEQDLLYLQEQGYTTILVQDLINYVEKDVPLPPKPIMITFDDGYYNNYHYVLPIIKKYQIKAIVSPICYQSQLFSEKPDPNPNYAHLNWSNLNEMLATGLVEIQNHSYNLHDNAARKGAKIKPGEDCIAYEEFFIKDTQKCQKLLQEKINVTPTAYTYPFGAYCEDSERILKEMGFKATFITCDKNNLITKDPNCLYKLNRYNRPANISTAEFMKKIQPQNTTTQ